MTDLVYDCIIIGGGLGGLTAGAKLAKSGKKVLLIEQHDRPGGCATTFKRKGFTLEVGLHEMDGLHPGDMKSKIFRDLGILEKVEFVKVPEFYRFVNDRIDLVVSHYPEQMISRLTDAFPGEKAGIESYFNTILNIRQLIKQSSLDPQMTIGSFLDEIINNSDLKLVLLGNLGYFTDDPYQLSLGYYCMAQNSYYTGGGNFIKGGSQKLSNALMELIENEGGTVLLNHLATGILVESDRVSGVTFQKTRNGSRETARALDVVVNASLPQTSEHLLPAAYRNFKQEFSHLKPGPSLLTVYFGFRESPARLGYHNYSSFVFDPSILSPKDVKKNNQGPWENRAFTFVDYSQIDSGLAPAGKAVGAICTMDYTNDWNQLSPTEYQMRKKEVEQIFRKRLDQFIPGIEELIEYCEVGTAKTVQRYTLNPEGSVYGFAQTPERVSTRISSPFENLHFASAWTQTGGGFSGAIFSGYLAAMDILRKRRG